MNSTKTLESEWLACFARMQQGEFFQLMKSGDLLLGHYQGFLRETYHNTSQNPKTMALFMAHLPGGNRALEAKFTKHTAMEIGHDELALDDLRQLGVDPEPVRKGRPMPITEAMSGFIVFQIQHRNPLAYLGYLYHLEALPMHFGGNVIGALAKMGVPASATSFLREHAEADPVHVKWNREYMEGFIRTEADLDAAIYGMRGTCELHALMFTGILDQYRDWKPAPASDSVLSP